MCIDYDAFLTVSIIQTFKKYQLYQLVLIKFLFYGTNIIKFRCVNKNKKGTVQQKYYCIGRKLLFERTLMPAFLFLQTVYRHW